MGAHDETGRRVSPEAANPSSLAKCALCRQTPEVGAECPNWARPDLCGGRGVTRVPTANKKRQQLQSFLLRHGRIFTGQRQGSAAYLRWLAEQKFDHPAQQIVFQDLVDAVRDATERLARFERHIEELVPVWSMAPFVAAYQALRGVSLIVAVIFAVEIGDVHRFENPRQLMAFLGLVPSERSTGDSVKRGGLTLAGNRRARRALVEGAWGYRHPARVTETIRKRLENLPKVVRDIAWKAQVRLCKRYRQMTSAGKKAPIVIAAIAREMAAFLWAIGRAIDPQPTA